MIGKRKRYGPMYYGVGAKGTMNAIKSINRIGRAMYQGKRFRTKLKKPGYSGVGVTFENDRQGVYRRKRMPTKYKRRWKRLIRLDNAIDLKKSGSRTFVFNKTATSSNNNSARHGETSVPLYSAQSDFSEWSDLHYIGINEQDGTDPTAAEGLTLHPTTKLYFQSAVLDLTIRNTSHNNDVPTVPSVPLEVDIYEITSSKKWMERDAASLVKYNSLSSIFQEGQGDRLGINNLNAADYRDRGMTPFDCTAAVAQYGLRILKKTKYRIGPGNTITYQMRDPKNRVTTLNTLKDMVGGNKPGWTKTLYVVFKATPGFTIGSGEGQETEQIKIGMTRKYMYKIANATEKRVSHVSR